MSLPLHQLSIEQIHQGLTNKDFTVQELVEHLLKRINQYNQDFNIFLTINPNAIDHARDIDKQIAKHGVTKPLQGIPIAVKDNFLTKDLITTASSKLLKRYLPQYESTVTQKLRDAGAIIIGKTNMDAWAHGSSTESSDFGPTLNPWNKNHLPGGSSGGSAAAVAAQLVPAAMGTETAGSVRQPAAWCGVVGFKPTYGRVSRYGCIAMASSTDSPGPITRNVHDAALITSVIAGQDPYDATSSPTPVKKYHTQLNKKDLKGIKIALVKEYLIDGMDKQVKQAVLDAADHLRSLGAQVDQVSLLDPKYSIGVYTIIQRGEVSSNLARFDGVRYAQDRQEFSEEAKRRIMLGTYTLSAGYRDAYYKKALAVRTKIVQEFDQLYKKYDLVLGAVSPTPALKKGASAKDPLFGEMQDVLVEPSSITGLTSISLPCGFVNKLPVAIQLTGQQFDESTVFSVAQLYQQTTDYQQFPQLS